VDENTLKKEKINQFRRKTGAPADEAKFYLEQSDFDLDGALEQWNLDTKWELETKKTHLPKYDDKIVLLTS
jgi:hypothetical protein